MTEQELQLLLDETCKELTQELHEKQTVTKDDFWKLLFTKTKQD